MSVRSIGNREGEVLSARGIHVKPLVGTTNGSDVIPPNPYLKIIDKLYGRFENAMCVGLEKLVTVGLKPKPESISKIVKGKEEI